METGKAIDHMSKTVLNRPGAWGMEKQKTEPTQLKVNQNMQKIAFWANLARFAKGFVGIGKASKT